jgi:CBS domain-containing protein
MKDHLDAILHQKGRRVHSVGPLTTVAEAVRIMVNERIGSLLVIDGGRPIGIFTERDAMCRVLHVGRDSSTTMITQVMTPNPVTVSPWTTVEDAMVIMTERHFRRLPVVANGKVLGLISIGDLTKWVVRDNDQLVEYITGTYPG